MDLLIISSFEFPFKMGGARRLLKAHFLRNRVFD